MSRMLSREARADPRPRAPPAARPARCRRRPPHPEFRRCAARARCPASATPRSSSGASVSSRTSRRASPGFAARATGGGGGAAPSIRSDRLSLVSSRGSTWPAARPPRSTVQRVAERAHLVELVADVEDRAALGGELAQGREQPLHHLRRQHGRRLVENQQLRARQQRPHDLDALALADGQAATSRAGLEVHPVHAGDAGDSRATCARVRDPSRRRSSPSQTFSATVSVSNSAKCWNTMAMPSARACRGFSISHGPPFQAMAPASGRRAP